MPVVADHGGSAQHLARVSKRSLTGRSSECAGTWLLVGERQRGAPPSSFVGLRRQPVAQFDLRIPPLALVSAVAVAIALVSVYVPLLRIPVPGHKYAAAALLLIGLMVALVGVFQFRRARTTVNPMSPHKASALVSSGLFRWSRNPMYLGMAVALLGLAAWASSLAGYLLVLAFCWYLTLFQIIPEERALLATFGPEFAQYMAEVRRWV
jgi:protein-S-isoprenylcysteine O-methyltransferase Ste14